LGRFITADPTIQRPYDPQTLNRYSYCRNNPLKYTDPTGYGWFKKFWKKAKNFFKKNVKHIVNAVKTVVAIATFSVDPVGSTMLLASVGTSYGGRNTQKASRILGYTYLGWQVGRGIFDYYKGKGEWVYPREGINAGKTYSQNPNWYINGINTTRATAQRIADQHGYAVFYNPTHGPIADLVESGMQKFFGGSSISRQLAGYISEVSASGQAINLIFHSQGTIIGANALQMVTTKLAEGSAVTNIGPAVTQGTALSSFVKAGGSPENFSYVANSADPVYATTGTINPFAMIYGTVTGALTAAHYHGTDKYLSTVPTPAE